MLLKSFTLYDCMKRKGQVLLLTGGLGQVGYYVYLKLRDKYQILILDNKSSSKVEPPEDVLFFEYDIQNLEMLKTLPKLDYIVHCAAQVSPEKSVKDPIYDANINILGTLNLLEIARQSELKKFIYISSAATYGNPQFLPIIEDHPKEPLSPYGVSKLVAEKYVQLYSTLYDLNTTIIRPFNIYGPLQKEDDPYAGVIFKFIKRIREGKSPKIEGDGLQTRDFIHVEDIALATELVLKSQKSEGRIFNIGTGEAVSIKHLAEILISIGKQNLQVTHVDSRIGDIRESCASIELAKEILGFSPSVKLEDGLKDLYEKVLIK